MSIAAEKWRRTHRNADNFDTPFNKLEMRLATPYVHWWASRDVTARVLTGSFIDGGAQTQTLATTTLARILGRSANLEAEVKKASLNHDSKFGIANGEHGEPFRIHALPGYAINKNAGDTVWEPPKNIKTRIGTLSKDTVIIGIIDDGIAFGNSRFRLNDHNSPGKTRFLWAWLQGETYLQGTQSFGHEVFADDINTALSKHQHGDWFDEDSFNQCLNPPLAPGTRSPGARSLMASVAHGTHVLDLACGADVTTTPPAELEKQRIMTVVLPARKSIGMAGTFLEFYVVYAMRRIVEMADHLWRETFGDQGGFPIVLNLSYGQQAGPKTGTSLIEQEFRNLEHNRPDDAPLRLVMPVGNDNLTQSSARWNVNYKDDGFALKWRIPSQDQSSNFLEIWTDLDPGEGGEHPFPLEISVTPPGSTESEWQRGEEDVYFDRLESDGTTGSVRIYCETVSVPDMGGESVAQLADTGQLSTLGQSRMRYVIAVRPTLDHERPNEEAPAGGWTVAVRWTKGIRKNAKTTSSEPSGREVYFNIQVDQDPSAISKTNHRSYLENDWYRTHAPSGRVLDTLSYLPSEAHLAGGNKNLEPAHKFGAIHRRGTHNSLAVDKRILLIAGHRASDGRPADFSATPYANGRNPTTSESETRLEPVSSFPVDISPTQTGIRAAGPASGSTVTLRGTSFAAPQATRWVVSQLRVAQNEGETNLSKVGTAIELQKAARQSERVAKKSKRYPEKAEPEKLGSGRMELRR